MRKIKKGDKVKVMRGKDAGKEGEVLKVVDLINKKGKDATRVVVRGVNIVKKHRKPNPTLNIQGGILEFEKAVDVSNVMLIDPKTGKPTRVAFKIDEKTGKKVRIAKKSGAIIES
jgi:large subunit ribosomal protein L24